MTDPHTHGAAEADDGRQDLDQVLAERAALGDDRAFEALVVRLRPGLVALAGRVVRDGRAEDAVQVALLSFHRTLQTGDVPPNIAAWLAVVTRRAAIDQLRRTLPTEQISARDMPIASSAEADAEARGDLRDVLVGVAALPEDERDALLLRTVDGAGHREIGAQLNVSPGQARQLIHRARRRLRDAAAVLIPAWMAFRVQEARAASARVADWVGAGAAAGPARVAAAVMAVGAVGVVGAPATLSSWKGEPQPSQHAAGAPVAVDADRRGTAADAPRAFLAGGTTETTHAATKVRVSDLQAPNASGSPRKDRGQPRPSAGSDPTNSASADDASGRPLPATSSPHAPQSPEPSPAPTAGSGGSGASAPHGDDDDDRAEAPESAEPAGSDDTPEPKPAEAPERVEAPEPADDEPEEEDAPQPAESESDDRE